MSAFVEATVRKCVPNRSSRKGIVVGQGCHLVDYAIHVLANWRSSKLDLSGLVTLSAATVRLWALLWWRCGILGTPVVLQAADTGEVTLSVLKRQCGHQTF